MREDTGHTRRAIRNLGRVVGLLALVAALMVVVLGQGRAHVARSDEGDSGIVRGTVVSASPAAIEVRDTRGVVRRVAVAPTTLVLSDDEEFSVANLPDIRLAVTDLARGDSVEVVVEPNRGRTTAGIVTRLSPIEPTATAKAEPRR